jgi:F-type H+-transporting ATPase subunit delta
MAELSTVARPYAEAAFKLAQESGSVPAWSDLIAGLGSIAADPQVASRLGDPGLQPAKLAEFFGSLVPGGLTAEAKNFVLMLAENGRVELLPEIAAQFHSLRNAAEGKADLLIESAFPLEGAELAGLVASLQTPHRTKLDDAKGFAIQTITILKKQHRTRTGEANGEGDEQKKGAENSNGGTRHNQIKTTLELAINQGIP